MPVLHKEVGAMVFGRNGIWIGFGHALENLDVRHVELVSARSALIGADLALYDYAGFLGKSFDCIENFRRNGIFRDNSLNDAAAVAELGKEEFAAFPEVVEPSANGDGLAFVFADF